MPIYTIRNQDGTELQIDTEHGVNVYPPTQSGAICDIAMWPYRRRIPLTLQQARSLGDQDFRARRIKSCESCYWHNNRELVGECDQLCCPLRRECLLQGYEISPYPKQTPAPAAVPDNDGCCFLRMGVTWCLLSIVFRSPAALWFPAGVFALGLLLLLLANFQHAARFVRIERGEIDR